MSFVAIIMHCLEPTKERLEWKILSVTAIEIPHSPRFTLLELLRIQHYVWCNMSSHAMVL